MKTSQFIQCVDDVKTWLHQEYGSSGVLYDEEYEGAKESCSSALTPYVDLEKMRKARVVLFVGSVEEKEEALVKRLCGAIDERIAKCTLIKAEELERHNLWEDLFKVCNNLKHVLIPEMDFYKMPSLMKGYQKLPQRQLFHASLFLLSDLKSYNADPELKKSLWQTLLREL